MNLSERDKIRFWAKVDRSGECWTWKADLDRDGYGRFSVLHIMKKASRVAWSIEYGSIPEGLNVCHRCDNRACVNPSHLFLGTQSDNISDMHKKGRKSEAGESNGNAKLTERKVVEIRTLSLSGLSSYALAKQFSVTPTTIQAIVRRKRWTHV